MSAEDDVEIELELPRGKIEELLAQLSRDESLLKETVPVAHIANAEELPSRVAQARHPSRAGLSTFEGGGGATSSSSGPKTDTTLAWDPLERLAKLKEMKAKYSSVSEQRHQAEATMRMLEATPSAGDAQRRAAQLKAQADSDLTRESGLRQAAAKPFPPREGIPFQYRGVPGVVAPRVRAPPEGEQDWLEAGLEDDGELVGGGEFQRTLDPDLLFRKEGLDMGFQHLKTHGARMAHQSREQGRILEETAGLREISEFQADPRLVEQAIRQQSMILEQQRLADELKLDKQIEEERQFFESRRAFQLSRERKNAKNGGGSSPDAGAGPGARSPKSDAPEDATRRPAQGGAAATRRGGGGGGGGGGGERGFTTRGLAEHAGSSSAGQTLHPAFRYMSDGPAEPGSPMSHYAEELSPSAHHRRRLAQKAGDAALNSSEAENYLNETTAGARAVLESALPSPEPEPAPVTGTGNAFANFFAGFWTSGTDEQQEREDEGAKTTPRSRNRQPSISKKATSAKNAAGTPASARRGSSGSGAQPQQQHQRQQQRSITPPPNRVARTSTSAASGWATRSLDSKVRRPEESRDSKEASPQVKPKVRSRSQTKEKEKEKSKEKKSRPQDAPPAAPQPEEESSWLGSLPFAAFAGVTLNNAAAAVAAQKRLQVTSSTGGGASAAERWSFGGPAMAATTPGRSQAAQDEDNEDEDEEDGEEEASEEPGWWSIVTGDAAPEAPPRKRPSQARPRGSSQAAGRAGASGGGGARSKAFQHPLKGHFVGAFVEKSKEKLQPAGAGSIEDAEENLLAARDAGKFGQSETAPLALDYLIQLSDVAERAAQDGEAHKHVSLISDIVTFYPFAAEIHLGAVEVVMTLFRNVKRGEAETLAGPIFQIATDLMYIHEEEKSLHTSIPELPSRLLALFALVVMPSTATYLLPSHIDFALRVGSGPGVGPLLLEHSLQLFLVGKVEHRLKSQAETAVQALKSFRAESQLVPRALLALGAIFDVGSGRSEDGAGGGGDSGDAARQRAAQLLEPVVLPSSRVGAGSGSAGAGAGAGVGGWLGGGGGGGGNEVMLPIGLREVTGVMDLYAQDRKVQGAGSVALASAAALPGISHEAFSREGAVRSMVLAQRHFPASRSVALHLAQIVTHITQHQLGLLNIELVLQVVSAAAVFLQDGEVVAAALEAVHGFAPRLQELGSMPGGRDKVAHMASDLVQLGEARHADSYSMSVMMVVLAITSSDGTATQAGGSAGEQWRAAFGRTAAVALPLRVLYEHFGNAELCCAAAIALRCLTFSSQVACLHVGQLEGSKAITSALLRHDCRPDTARELLSALGNSACDELVKMDFQRGLPRTKQVLWKVILTCASEDPDVLAQGCRAMGALFAKDGKPGQLAANPAAASSDGKTKAEGGEGESAEVDFDSLFETRNIAQAAHLAVEGITARGGGEEQAGLLGFGGGTAQQGDALKKKLREICLDLCLLKRASGPVFGRLLELRGDATAECVPRRPMSRPRR